MSIVEISGELSLAGLSADRRRVADRLICAAAQVGHNDAGRRLEQAGRAISSCCYRVETFSLHRTDARQDSIGARARCRNRHCPYCHAVDGSRIAEMLTDIVAAELAAGAGLAMLTLTVKHSAADDLRGLRKTLDKAFARFSKRQLFRAVVAEYHRVGEIERSAKNGWHPHFHLLIKFLPEIQRRELQKLWAAGRLRESALWRWYVRSCRRQGKKPDAARFVTLSPSMLESFLREEWFNLTFRLSRPSPCIRLTMIRAGRAPGTAQKRWKGADGRPRRLDIPVSKLVKEFTKYITKRQATGSKAGQLGFFDYTHWQLVDYLRGSKNWHMHQSSSGWAAVAAAAEADDILRAEADDAAGDYRTINYLDLAELGTRAVAGSLCDDGLAEFEADGLRCLSLLDGDKETDGEQSKALRSALAHLFGDDLAGVVSFPLTAAQSARIVNGAKCREFPAILAANRDAFLVDGRTRRRLEAQADDMARRDAVDQAADSFAQLSLFGWSESVQGEFLTMKGGQYV